MKSHSTVRLVALALVGWTLSQSTAAMAAPVVKISVTGEVTASGGGNMFDSISDIVVQTPTVGTIVNLEFVIGVDIVNTNAGSFEVDSGSFSISAGSWNYSDPLTTPMFMDVIVAGSSDRIELPIGATTPIGYPDAIAFTEVAPLLYPNNSLTKYPSTGREFDPTNLGNFSSAGIYNAFDRGTGGNFNWTVSSIESTAVPEPSQLGALGLICCAVLGRVVVRRKRSTCVPDGGGCAHAR